MPDVKCVVCKELVPMAGADLTGNGYRCSRCSLLGEDRASAHLTDQERRAGHNKALGVFIMGLVITLGGVIWIAMAIVNFMELRGAGMAADTDPMRVVIRSAGALVILISGLVTASRGWSNMRHMRQ